MSYQAVPPSTGGSSTVDGWRTSRSALYVSGGFGTDPIEYYDDFHAGHNKTWTDGSSGGGSIAVGGTSNPSCILLSSSASAGGAGLATLGASGNICWFGGASAKHYFRAKFKLLTTVDASAQLWPLGLGGNLLGFGVLGSTSTTVFSIYGATGAVTALSTIGVDTLTHTAELWVDGTALKFSVDNEAVVSATVTIGANTTITQFVGNGATAAQRQLATDYTYHRQARL